MGAPISEITPPVNSTTTPPVGEIFPPPARLDGALIKYEDREDVYLIEGGKKRPIFETVFNQCNLDGRMWLLFRIRNLSNRRYIN